ncbi:MAG TPA: MaoC family dehydratase [Acidimicrobiales bacterium]|nr:MaoC family dehydratase [Acidimicrobiales bacterium]
MAQPQTRGSVIDLADLPSHAGEALGHSSWRRIAQDEVTAFARLTGDEQWIHVDPQRAAAGPFGATVAHGYFTLSLATVLLDEVLTIDGAGLVLNYGSDRVRYPAPVRVGSRVRALIELAAVKPLPGGSQVTYRLTYEVEGQPKPGCVAEIVYHYYVDRPGGSTGSGS